MHYAAEVPVLRVSVNVGNSTGSSGLDTNLAPTMTVGTGFVGRSSLGENLQPKHLVNWTRIAYNADVNEPFPSYVGLDPWRHPTGPVPAYPVASNQDAPAVPTGYLDQVVSRVAATSQIGAAGRTGDDAAFREEIRRLVADELSRLIKN